MNANEFTAALKSSRNPHVVTIDRDLKDAAKTKVLHDLMIEATKQCRTTNIAIAIVPLK